MGKFHRLSIGEAQNEFPLLNEEAKKSLKGGCELHRFFGDGLAHDGDEVYELATTNSNHEKDRSLWVCDVGLVSINGNRATVTNPMSDFWVCNLHPHSYQVWMHDCTECYTDTLDYCDKHFTYFQHLTACPGCYGEYADSIGYCNIHQHEFEGYCSDCDETPYCGKHLNYYMDTCDGCEREDFERKYPNGCFLHGSTGECQACKEGEIVIQ